MLYAPLNAVELDRSQLVPESWYPEDKLVPETRLVYPKPYVLVLATNLESSRSGAQVHTLLVLVRISVQLDFLCFQCLG